MKATEGNGGPGLVMSREPVERPRVPRGTWALNGHVPPGDDSRVTFSREIDGFDVTFHDCQVTDAYGGSITVFVSPFDVVTWTKRD